MIEPGKLGFFNDLAALCTLIVKYRGLRELIEDRDAFIAQGRMHLDGRERQLRRVQQIRLAKQFPGVLAELEWLTSDDVSELLTHLRFYSERSEQLPDEVKRAVHLVNDYHFALRVVLSGDRKFIDWLPSSLKETSKGEGRSRHVGLWVREKYGLESQSRVWKLDIGWIRGVESP